MNKVGQSKTDALIQQVCMRPTFMKVIMFSFVKLIYTFSKMITKLIIFESVVCATVKQLLHYTMNVFVIYLRVDTFKYIGWTK